MPSQVIARFEGRNYAMTIELTKERTCVDIGSDYLCRKGYINQDETIIAPFHCRVYLQKCQKGWKTLIQEEAMNSKKYVTKLSMRRKKAMNSKKYVTYVNKHKLSMRGTQWLFDNDEIKIGSGKNLISFVYRDTYTINEEAKILDVPKFLLYRFKNMNEEIGNGAHSRIYLAHDVEDTWNPIKCVCKVVTITKEVPEETFEVLCQEPKILETLDHPNIVKVLGHHRDFKPNRLLMWQEMLGEDLGTYIYRVKTVDQNCWRVMSLQILSALKYLHNRNIVRCDLKPANIMWDCEHKNLKLIDFGMAKNRNRLNVFFKETKIRGTPLYTPPEIYKGSPEEFCDLYKPSVDIWAFGVLSYVILSGTYPFLNEDEYECLVIFSLQNYIVTRDIIPKGPLQKKKIDEPVVRLITEKILSHDLSKRITAGMINVFLISYFSLRL